MIEILEEVEGWYSIEIAKVDAQGNEIPGTRRQPLPPFRNLITNAGLNRMATADDWLSICQVGTSSASPLPTDTALGARKASSSDAISRRTAAQSSAPYYCSNTATFRFSAGSATGNLTEVGVGWASTGGLFSRALIVDTAGAPTTLTVLADEVLDVTYQFRAYPPLIDKTGVITLAGDNYEWVGRACNVSFVSASEGWTAPEAALLSTVGAGGIAYNGTIGAITTFPSGSPAHGATSANLPYSNDSFTREGTLTFGLTQGNLSGGIGAVHYKQGMGAYQIGFTPNIPKDGTKVLTLTVRTTWARKAL